MQKFTIRPVVLSHKANSKGITSIKIAVTVDRKVTYINTSHRIHLDQWDGQNKAVYKHENAKLINVSIRRKIAEIERDLINNSIQGVQLSKRIIKGQVTVARSFKQYAKEVKWDQTKLNRIIDYGGEQLLISDVTVEWLRKFETWCRKKPLAQNTIHTTIKYVSRIITQARKEKIIHDDPFDQYIKPKYQQTDRLYLVDHELKLMVDLLDKPMSKSMHDTLCYFLLACYTGLRHSDWGRFSMSNVEDGHIKLRALKNKTHVVLPIGKTLSKILIHIENTLKPLSNQKCNVMLKSLASMAGIDKEISTHSGRHSFGYMCAANGLPESTTAALLGVNANTVKVYYHLTGDKIKHQASALMHV